MAFLEYEIQKAAANAAYINAVNAVYTDGPSAPTRQTPDLELVIKRLHSLAESLQSSATRIESALDRVQGETPAVSGEGKSSSAGGGMLGELNAVIGSIANKSEWFANLSSRIERIA